MKASRQNTKARVMIVEDENIVAKDIQNRLETLGYAVTATVSSGDSAIKNSEKDPPDLIILDIRLKGELDGIQTASRIKQIKDIPVIYLTAYADSKTFQRAKQTMPYGYIVKPVEDSELKSTIELALYKHRIENKLKESEKRHRMIFENANDIIIYIDKSGKIININKKIEEILAYPRSSLLNKNFWDMGFLKTKDIARLQREFNDLVRSKKPLSSLEITVNDRYGHDVHIEANVTPIIIDDEPQGFLLVVRDITARKKVEDKLTKTLNQLRKERKRLELLANKIINVQEQERRYLASEIHDDLLQSIVAVLYFFQALDISMLDKKMQEKKNTLMALIRDTIDRGRRLINEIEPIREQGFGLIQAVSNSIRLRFTDTDINVKFSHPDSLPSFNQAFETNVLRIIQEALFNIYKYAMPTIVWIKISFSKQNLIVNIRDNGIGFKKKAKEKKSSRHYGLLIMQERAKLIGGEVIINSKLNVGTTVKGTFPLPKT